MRSHDFCLFASYDVSTSVCFYFHGCSKHFIGFSWNLEEYIYTGVHGKIELWSPSACLYHSFTRKLQTTLLKFSVLLFLWIRNPGLFRHIILPEIIYQNTGSAVFNKFTLKERIWQNTIVTLTVIIWMPYKPSSGYWFYEEHTCKQINTLNCIQLNADLLCIF